MGWDTLMAGFYLIAEKLGKDPSLPLAQAVRANLFATYAGRPPASVWTQRGKAWTELLT